MTFEEFLAAPFSKYAILRKENYDMDEVAQSISSSPRTFIYDEIEFVILSLNIESLTELYNYLVSIGIEVEYTFQLGTGKLTLLNHPDALVLLDSLPQEPDV